MLKNFNKLVFNQNLKKETASVLKNNTSLQVLNYTDIESQLRTVLKSLQVKALLPQDIDLFLLKEKNQFLIKGFFEIRTVIDQSAFLEWAQKIEELLQAGPVYSEQSTIPDGVLLKQLRHASLSLENYETGFGNLPNSHLDRKETQTIVDWVLSPLTDKSSQLALVEGNAGSGKTVILKENQGIEQRPAHFGGCIPVAGCRSCTIRPTDSPTTRPVPAATDPVSWKTLPQ